MDFSRSIAGARAAWGPDWADASDDEILRAYARSSGVSLGEAADQLGYDPGRGSMQGERWSSSIDSYQGSLYGLGEAAAKAIGADAVGSALRSRRQANETQAAVAAERAKGLGGIDSYKDVEWFDPSSVWNYASGLGIQSAPYLLETVAGGLIGRGLAKGARVGLSVADDLGMDAAKTAAQTSLNRASLTGAGAASYPSAVGDILSNQRDTGQPTDLLSAAVGGVPYAALNLLGPEATLAKGALFRNAWRGLDNIPGVRGVAARTGATMLTQGGMEGVGETGQELVNQYFGRMAVDPNETLFSPDAVDRYGESFVGGAVLGGGLGGALGGWRRGQFQTENQPQPPAAPPVTEQPGGDLLGLPWNGYYTQQHGPPGQGVFVAGMGPEATTYTPLDRAVWYDPTVQGELFPTDEVPRGAPSSSLERWTTDYRPEYAPAPDTQTADMFANRPDALVQTDFNTQQVLRELAAVTEGIPPDAWTVKLAGAISRNIANPSLRDALAQERRKQESRFNDSPDPNDWTFDSQAQLDRTMTRLYQLDAAEAVVDRYWQRMTDAQVQAAAARGQRPGFTQQAPAQTTGSEEDIRVRNALQAQEEALAETDARVAAGRQDQADRRRQAILDEVLGDPETTNARGRFTARLKKLGIKDTALRSSEVARIDRWAESRAAFNEPGQGELNFGAVAPGQTQDVVPPTAAMPEPTGVPKGQLKFPWRKPNAVQVGSAEKLDVRQQTRDGQALAEGNAQGQVAAPGQQATAVEEGRPRKVKTYSEYNNIAVTLPAKPGVSSVDRKVLNVGERLRELDSKANKYRALINCLSS